MRQYRIPVTVIASTTATAYMIFNVDGDTQEELNVNLAKLAVMDSDELNEFVDFSIKPFHDFNKYPPVNDKVAYAHIEDAELF